MGGRAPHFPPSVYGESCRNQQPRRSPASHSRSLSPKADREKWGVGLPAFLCQSMWNPVGTSGLGDARRHIRGQCRRRLTEKSGGSGAPLSSVSLWGILSKRAASTDPGVPFEVDVAEGCQRKVGDRAPRFPLSVYVESCRNVRPQRIPASHSRPISPKADREKWGVGRPAFLRQSIGILVETSDHGGARRPIRGRFRHKLTEKSGGLGAPLSSVSLWGILSKLAASAEPGVPFEVNFAEG